MEENKTPFGKLFNSIVLDNDSHLELILSTMNKTAATFILTQAVKYAYEQGIYTIGESEVISKSIRVLGKSEDEQSTD